MSSTLSRPPHLSSALRRVGILATGGNAPGTNATLSSATVSFLRNDIQVLGLIHGYSHIIDYSPDRPLEVGRDYRVMDHSAIRGVRRKQGVELGTAKTDPGRYIANPAHLNDPERTGPLRRIYEGLRSLEVDALVSMGDQIGLATAYKFKMVQEQMPDDARRIQIVHVPRGIDNDQRGIDFTPGYFTALETVSTDIASLHVEAQTTQSYVVAETIGRFAGWLAYGASMTGDASLVIGTEDLSGDYVSEESVVDPSSSETSTRPVMNVDRVIDRIVKTMLARENEGHAYGVVVLSEGLAEFLPVKHLVDIPRDEHGHISVSQVDLARMFAALIAEGYHHATGRRRRVRGLQLGYDAQCSQPLACDVLFASQLGVGAYRALVEYALDGVMVSLSGQADLNYVPFEQLIDPKSFSVIPRFVELDSDFHQLARFLETYVNE